MPLDDKDRCGIGWLSTSDKDWMSPVCKLHDSRWIDNYSFIGATKEFYMYSLNRAEMLGKSKIKALAYIAIGTVFGAPIWAARKIWRAIT